MVQSRVLVVEDEEGIRIVLRAFLEEDGCDVTVAGSCTEARKAMSHKEFDLVVSDIVLDDGTGVQLLRELRGRGVQHPVIMITGYPNIATAQESLRLGAFDYIAKPFQKEDILRVVRRALEFHALSLREERTRRNLQAVFRSVSEGVLTVDTQLNVIEANEAACDFIGMEAGDVEGLPLSELFDEEYGKVRPLIERSISAKQRVEELFVEFSSLGTGTRMAGLVATPLLDEQYRVMGGVLVIRDETELHHFRREQQQRSRLDGIVGASAAMQRVFSLMESFANVQSSVLITGESGTGKTRVAEILHRLSHRRERPFVRVDCTVLSDELLASELFGHVKGAYTGALADRVGRFEKADGGTVLLDEIGDISPRMQLMLLRVVQDGVFERVGDSEARHVDVRIIAATNRNLKERMKRGEFREDLYYRLNVLEIEMPPLRQRREDIPLLAGAFIDDLKARMPERKVSGISDEALRVLQSAPWPGNVRELYHVLEHAFVVTPGGVITITSLPQDIREPYERERTASGYKGITEKILREALERTRWNKTEAARLIGVDRRTIYRKIREFKMDA